MNSQTFWQQHLRRIVATGIVFAAFFWARTPVLTMELDYAPTDQFAFARLEVPTPPNHNVLGVDDVKIHPDVEHIKAWVMAAGASAALGDIDGDGVSNDLCFIDTRTDSTAIMPAPGTSPRYDMQVLKPPARASDQPLDFPTGCLIADLDEDGSQDAVVYFTTRPPVAFLQRDGQFVPQELVANPDEVWSTAAGIVADLDGDGHLDLMFGNYFLDGARMYDPNDTDQIWMNDSLGYATNGGTTRFLLWEGVENGQVRYRHVTDALPTDISRGWTLALGAADFDGDLLPEIYMGNDFGPDRFLHNQSTPGNLKFKLVEGRRSFFAPKSKTVGLDSFKGMGVDVADVNGDGLLDFGVSNITSDFAFQESNFMYINTGDERAFAQGYAPFVDESQEMGLARSGFSWDIRFGDFNNDTRLEVLQATGFAKGEIDQYPELHERAIANDALIKYPQVWAPYDGRHDLAGHEPNRFWTQNAVGTYVDIGQALGVTRNEVTRGIATADVDGDGDLDFVFANQWEPSYFHRNDCPDCGNFLGLRLQLPYQAIDQIAIDSGEKLASRPAIGSHVRITSVDGFEWVGIVDGSNGHSGKRAPEVHVGLGEISAELTVEVTYRDQMGDIQTTTFTTTPGWHTIYLP